MKTKLVSMLATLIVGLAFVVSPAWAQDKETINTRIGEITTELGTPTKESITKLYDEMDFQRATQAYLWGMPAVGLYQWKKSSDEAFNLRNGQLAAQINFEDKLGCMTPNLTTPYICGVVDLEKSGPFVFEVPKGLTAGGIVDIWGRELATLGMLGPDKGEGGKYLLLGPGQTDPQAPGYFVAHSPTFNVWICQRLLDPDKDKAIREQMPQMLSYAYSERDNPPKEQVVKIGGRKWSQTPPSGMAYWERLAEVVRQEPVAERDRFFMAMLKPLGIEKGKPFNPDARQRKILTEASIVGELMAKASAVDKRFVQAFWPNTRWKDQMFVTTQQRAENYEQLEERTAYYWEATTIFSAMLIEKPGEGQKYMATYQSKDGAYLDGGQSYRLHVPPNPPAKQFWSVTVYDESTRRVIVSPSKIPDVSSRTSGLVKNADGSVDVYFGPTAPKGFEKNWVQTVPGKGWFTYFRFYAPTEAFFDKSWSLPDIEKVM